MPDAPPGDGHRPLRLAILNDYEIVVAGLETMLAPFTTEVQVVGWELGSPAALPPDLDIALLDVYGMPSYGYDRVDRLAADPDVRHVAVFTFAFDRRHAEEVLARGASGYLSKAVSAVRLVDDLRRIAAGEVVVRPPEGGLRPAPTWPAASVGLTQRESHILAMLATGRRNAEIAEALFVSVDTVKTHLRSVYRKLGVTNRAQAVAVALADTTFSRRGQDIGATTV